MKLFNMYLLGLCCLLHGCGGGGGSASDNPPPEEIDDTTTDSVNTGVFLDSPVMNLSYRTESQRGTTNANGEFKYLDGENITFSIGGTTFPKVSVSDILTLLDLADIQSLEDSTVINMARLLQTLDEDRDTDNGITIPQLAASTATEIDFSQSVEDFENDPAVLTLIQNAGQNEAVTELISTSEALEHVGRWLLYQGNYKYCDGFLVRENVVCDGKTADLTPAIHASINFYSTASLPCFPEIDVEHNGIVYSTNEGRDDDVFGPGVCYLDYDYTRDDLGLAADFYCETDGFAIDNPDFDGFTDVFVDLYWTCPTTDDAIALADDYPAGFFSDVTFYEHHMLKGNMSGNLKPGSSLSSRLNLVDHFEAAGVFDRGQYKVCGNWQKNGDSKACFTEIKGLAWESPHYFLGDALDVSQ